MVPTVIEFLPRYAADVSSFLAGPIEFLNSKKAEENGDAQSRAFVFLLTSAILSALLEANPAATVSWQYVWDAFRLHMFPTLLFVLLQVLVATHAGQVEWRAFFAVYAYAYGMLLVVRSILLTVGWFVAGGASVVVSATVSLTLVLLLTAAVLYIWWTAGVHSRLIGIVVASTLACGFFSAYFEMASDDRQRISGVFESVLLLATNEYATHTPLQLRVGDRGGRIQPSDPFQDGKHRDIWAYDGRPEQSLCLFIRATGFRPHLQLLSPNGELVKEKFDDGPASTGTRLFTDLHHTGRYTLIVTTQEPYQTGNYSLAVSTPGQTAGPRCSR